MRFLVVGYGLIGRQRVQALARDGRVEEVLVTDPLLGHGDSLGPKTRSIDTKAAYEDRYNGVIIATPHDVVMAVLPRASHCTSALLLEKPLGRSAQEAATLAAIAQSASCRLFVGFNYRFLKNVQHLKNIIESGQHGRILAVDAVLAHGAEPGYEKSWKTDKEHAGGGVCIDPGVHIFDLLQWLFGEIALEGGALARSFWPVEVEDHAALSLRLAGGTVAAVFLSIASWQSRFEITVELENAQLLLRGRGKFYGPQRLTMITKWPWLHADAARETTWDYGSEDSSFAIETAEFVRAAGDPAADVNIASALEALNVMQVVDRCYDLPLIG